ncbi:MAG: DUF4340 domain-containing protein [Phycisphaerae bacterium]|nr:DUF4340 domain-containing protein [Phycisphaerae bacterium]
MNPKTTIGLVVALIIAVIGVWWAQSSSSRNEPKEARLGPKALFDPPLGELTRFELQVGDSPAFVFEMADEKWRMTSPVRGPSEHWKVNSDATKIKNLKYAKAYGKDDAERPTAEMTSLDDPLRTVRFTDKDGKSYVVKIGKKQALSSKTYVQREGDDTIYLVDADLNSDLRKGLSDYRGKRVAEFTQADAVRIDVSGEQQYTLVKSEGNWTVERPVKGRVDAGKVSSLLRGVSNLNVSAFVDDAPSNLRPYGLDPPRLRVAVTTETKTEKPPPEPPASAPAEPDYDVETRTIRVAFGGTADDKVFAKIDEESSPAVFQVASSVLDEVGPTLEDVRDKKITAINTNRAQRLVVSSGGETIELVKSDGKWRIAGGAEGGAEREAEFAAVDDLLKAIRDLKAIGFESAELPTHGFEAPRATVEVSAEGQLEPAKLVVGGLTPSKTGAYIRNEREGFVAVVKAESAEALVVKPMSFLSRGILKFTRGRASRIELVRGDAGCAVDREGSRWRFVSPVQGEAESDAVNNVLSDLSNLRGRQVVGRAADAAEFGLHSPAVRVTVTVDAPPRPEKRPTTQPASQPVEALEEGPEAPEPPTLHTVLVARHEDKVYAMTDGGETICEVDGKVLDDLEAELFSTKVAMIEPSRVRRLSFGGEDGFSFVKDGNTWELSGEPSFATDAAKIVSLLDSLRDLRAKHYVRYGGANPAEFGLDRPAAAITAETEGGESVTLTVSPNGPGGDDRYAAVSTADGRVFVMKSEDVAKFAKSVRVFEKMD